MMLIVDNFMYAFVAIIHAGLRNCKVNQNAFPHWEYQEQHFQRICCNDLIWIQRLSDRALIKCMQNWHNDENGCNDMQSEKLSFILIKNYCFRHSAFKYAYLEQVSWNNMISSPSKPVKIARLFSMCSISSNYEKRSIRLNTGYVAMNRMWCFRCFHLP